MLEKTFCKCGGGGGQGGSCHEIFCHELIFTIHETLFNHDSRNCIFLNYESRYANKANHGSRKYPCPPPPKCKPGTVRTQPKTS